MTSRHHVSDRQRQFVKERAEELANAVPENMVEGLRHMLSISEMSGLSKDDAYSSVTEAIRALQAPHRPHEKAWLVLEAGCLWLERERKKDEA